MMKRIYEVCLHCLDEPVERKIIQLESVGMVHYKNVNIEYIHNHAEILLRGDVEHIGKTLFLSE